MVMDIRTAMRKACLLLDKSCKENPVLDAGIILSYVLGVDRTYLYSHPERILRKSELLRFFELVGKRADGMPVQYLIGWQEFMSLKFYVNENVLIPRADTEVLVEKVIEYVKCSRDSMTRDRMRQEVRKNPEGKADKNDVAGRVHGKDMAGQVDIKDSANRTDNRGMASRLGGYGRQDMAAENEAGKPGGCEKCRILDIGTGSGCIAVSLARFIENSRVVAVDISEGALEVAEKNCILNNVLDRVTLMKSDLYSYLKGDEGLLHSFDIIVTNPPYIKASEISALQTEVRDFEPREALDGGEDGLRFYREIVKDAPLFLKKGGLLAMEIGYDQREDVMTILKDSGLFSRIRCYRDYSQQDRVVFASYAE